MTDLFRPRELLGAGSVLYVAMVYGSESGRGSQYAWVWGIAAVVLWTALGAWLEARCDRLKKGGR